MNNGTASARVVVRRVLPLVLALAAAACSGSGAEPATPAPPSWEDRTIRSTGRGAYPDGVNAAQARLMAERAARADAYRKLTEQLYGVEIRSGTTVRDALLASDVIKARFDGFIQGARVIDTRRDPSIGLVEIDMELTIDEAFVDMLAGR